MLEGHLSVISTSCHQEIAGFLLCLFDIKFSKNKLDTSLLLLFLLLSLQRASVTAMPTFATSTQESASVPPRASRETSVSCECANPDLTYLELLDDPIK